MTDELTDKQYWAALRDAEVQSARGERVTHSPIVHRASIPFGDNDFMIDQSDGRAYSTCIERSVPLTLVDVNIAAEIKHHRTHGKSEHCVICNQPSDITAMQARLDELEKKIGAAMDKAEADTIFEEMLELQHKIEHENGRMDDWAEARLSTKYHSPL